MTLAPPLIVSRLLSCLTSCCGHRVARWTKTVQYWCFYCHAEEPRYIKNKRKVLKSQILHIHTMQRDVRLIESVIYVIYLSTLSVVHLCAVVVDLYLTACCAAMADGWSGRAQFVSERPWRGRTRTEDEGVPIFAQRYKKQTTNYSTLFRSKPT
jgi:hypothetical protein